MNKYWHDRNFFSNINILTAYWAGFLAADGSLDETNKCLRLRLSQKDSDHIVKFKKALNFSGPIFYIEKTKAVGISIYSAEKHFYYLENSYNITSNKSLTLKPPTELEFYSNDIIKSFLIGVIDGDGCIKYCKRDGLLILDFFSASKDFIEWIKHTIERIYDLKSRKIYSYGKFNFTYRLNGKYALLVLKDLNNLSVPKLSRKWEKVYNFILTRDYE